MPDWAYIRELWRPLVEITILAVAIYYILIFVRGTRGWPVVIGFVVMLGLLSSLDSRGTLSSVVKTVAWVGVISGVVGLCAWNAAGGLSLAGAALGALSPASLAYVIVHPERLEEAISSGGLSGARVSLFVGAAIGAAIYIAIVYGIHAHMVRTFDQKVRKLAGAR